MAAAGRLRQDTILVSDEKESNTLYNKGAFGIPQSGGALVLDLVEALYLMENNRLDVEGLDVASLLRHAAVAEASFELRYVVYRDLRARGFVVKHSNLAEALFNVYPRGALPGRSPSRSLVACVSERDAFSPDAVLGELERARAHGKTFLLALVDEEGDLTYYDTRTPTLHSDVARLPNATARAHMLAERVMVLDRQEAQALHADGYFGRDVGLGLQLALPEAAYLAEEGRLDVFDPAGGRAVHADELSDMARRAEPDFDLRRALYRHLRAQGVVVKTGFKYGTHFRAYTGSPDEEHAPYLIHALPPGRSVAWPEVAGFVRLAHGVRKRLFFAVTDDAQGFRLVELSRTKP